jgi:hypothetical protein
VYNVRHPNSEPYHMVRRALEDGLKRSGRLGRRPRFGLISRPSRWARPVFATEVRAQIRARRNSASTRGCCGTAKLVRSGIFRTRRPRSVPARGGAAPAN